MDHEADTHTYTNAYANLLRHPGQTTFLHCEEMFLHLPHRTHTYTYTHSTHTHTHTHGLTHGLTLKGCIAELQVTACV